MHSKVLISLIVLVSICGAIEARSVVTSESENDCSPNVTINQLKALATNISCPDNDDRVFWEAACKCVVDDLPISECPLCRAPRDVDTTVQSSGSSETGGTHTFTNGPTETTTGLRNEQNMTDNLELRAKLRTNSHNSSSSVLSSSANFIRFGK